MFSVLTSLKRIDGMAHRRWLPDALILLAGFSAEPEPRPNIVWISVEALSPRLGCHGDELARR
jgi:hypothetical protein